jgi:hypothetical protein
VRCANAVRIRITKDWGWDSIYYVTGGVPLFAFAGSGVHLYELREINIARQAGIHRFDVGPEPIASELVAVICRGVPQLVEKLKRRNLGTASEVPTASNRRETSSRLRFSPRSR